MQKIIKHIGLLLLFIPFSLMANPYNQGQQSISEPAEVLRNGIELLTGYLGKNNGPNPEEMRKYLEIEILPFFDFEKMTAWSIGSAARSLNNTQKLQLTAILKERFLASMVGQLADYQGGKIQYLRPKGNPDRGKISLGVRIFGQKRYPIQIDFKLYAGRNGWKVYDVVANQTSAVAYYRKEFSYLLRQYGVDGLIQQAAKH
jgi:phospholipid transport system substrate-binding protein